jgi:4-oxalmesaconate hydratase
VKVTFDEMDRAINDLGFVGILLNPDPGEGDEQTPTLGDEYWYPLYEKMVELVVPALVHVSMSCNPAFHAAGAHYINGDTTAFMQLVQGDLFKDFPALRLVIPHGGGAVPYHWGRYRGIAQDMGKPPLAEHLLKNVFFDTCVYHQPGIDLLLEVIPAENILFASEIVGAVQGIDPETGHYFDDTRRYIDGSTIEAGKKQRIFESNARRVYPRLKNRGAVQ